VLGSARLSLTDVTAGITTVDSENYQEEKSILIL